MPEPTPAEIVPIALVREGLPAAPAIGSKEAVAADVTKRVDEGKWREGFEIAKKPSLDKKNTSERIEEIGANPDRDPATGKRIRTTEEQAVYDRAKKAETSVFKFLELGYDKVSPGEKKRLEGVVLANAKRNPALFAQLDPLTPDQQNDWARRKLRDPRYASEIGKMLVNIGDPENKLGNEVLLANDQFEIQDVEKKNKQLEIDDVDRRLAPVNNKLTAFERPVAGSGGTVGAKADELERLKSSLPTLAAELHTLNRTLIGARQREKFLDDERTATLRNPGTAGRRPIEEISKELTDASTLVSDTEEQIVNRQAQLGKIDILEKEEKQLEDQKQNLDKERRERQAEMNKIELELKRRQRLFMDAKALRASREEDIAKGLESVFAGATNELLDKEMQEYLTATNAELDAKKLKATDDNEKAIYDALQHEFLGPERIRRKGLLGFRTIEKYRPISKAKVDAYYGAIMANGPEEPMKRLLISRINPATGRVYTDPEATAILANKSEGSLYSKMQPEVVKQILARKMIVGGISPEDIHIVVNSRWGAGMIDQAKESNEAFRSAVIADMGPNALSSPEFTSKLAERIKKHPWWLFLILGIPFLVGGAAMDKTLQNIGK